MTIAAINMQWQASGAGEIHVDTSALGEWVEKWVKRAIELSKELNLRTSHELALRIDSDRPWVGEHFANRIMDLRSRIEDELKAIHFLFIPLSKAEFYDSPYFGEEVEKRFSGAVEDMREAGTCFALGRWTGVVHHCMGIVQEGMTELGKDLGCQLDIYLHDWNKMIAQLNSAITAKRSLVLGGLGKSKASASSKRDWNKLEPFYNEVLTDVIAMKNAWRNPGFHFRLPQMTESKAKKILDRVREFMENLAENLRV
jgi:hypothetical protein